MCLVLSAETQGLRLTKQQISASFGFQLVVLCWFLLWPDCGKVQQLNLAFKCQVAMRLDQPLSDTSFSVVTAVHSLHGLFQYWGGGCHLLCSIAWHARNPESCATAVGQLGDRWAACNGPGLQCTRCRHHEAKAPQVQCVLSFLYTPQIGCLQIVLGRESLRQTSQLCDAQMHKPALMLKPGSMTVRITYMFDSIAKCLAVIGVNAQNRIFLHLVGTQQKKPAR